jgi:hypothetical protein
MAMFPSEIIDKIILYTENVNLIVNFCTDYMIDKFYNQNPNKFTWKNACKNGYLSIVKNLHKTELKKYTTDNVIKHIHEYNRAFNWLSKHNYYNILSDITNLRPGTTFKWLKNDESRLPYVAMDLAVQKNHLDVVKYMYDNGYKCSDLSIDTAVRKNHLNMVKLLHECGYKCVGYSGDFAASRGRLEMVKWLHENGYKYSTDAIRLAKINKHYDVVEYLESSQMN